jgi:hypothetical protein
VISPELAAFLQSGIAILVGTRDGRLLPECTRGIGARVEAAEAGRAEVTVFVADAVAGATLANLRDNGRIAVAFSRASDHRTFQLKGRLVALGPATERDRADIEQYRCAWATSLAEVGLPPRVTLRMAHWPAHAARFRVDDVFVQTPGPGAGARLGAPEPR